MCVSIVWLLCRKIIASDKDVVKRVHLGSDWRMRAQWLGNFSTLPRGYEPTSSTWQHLGTSLMRADEGDGPSRCVLFSMVVPNIKTGALPDWIDLISVCEVVNGLWHGCATWTGKGVQLQH